MKYLFLLCLAISSSALYSQIVINNTVFPVIGDSLQTATNFNFSGTLSMGDKGGPHTWDFSVLNQGSKQTDYYVSPSQGKDVAAFPEATILLASDGQEVYIKSTGSIMEGLGFGGDNPFLDVPLVVKYSKRPALRFAPIEFINQTSSNGEFNIDLGTSIIPDTILASLPIKPDSIRIQFVNASKGIIDAYGKLKLQGKTFDVLREKAESITETKVFAKLPFIGWFDVSSVIGGTVPGNLQSFLGQDTTVTYNFYTNTKKEILVSADFNTSNELQGVTFADLGGVISSVKEESTVPYFTVYPNPAEDYLRISTTQWPEGKYFIFISDMEGRVVLFENASFVTGGFKDIKTSGLGTGQYILSVRDQFNKHARSVKFVVK